MTKQSGNSFFVALIVVAVMAAIGFALTVVIRNDKSDQKSNKIDNNKTNADDSSGDKNLGSEPTIKGYADYAFLAALSDVTEGKILQGISFEGTATGAAYGDYIDGSYELYATFENLPTAVIGTFYEGWAVGGKNGVVSTGKLELSSGVYTNMFTDSMDLSDSKRYVLTIEPDDNDPAPADHVVEGDFSSNIR